MQGYVYIVCGIAGYVLLMLLIGWSGHGIRRVRRRELKGYVDYIQLHNVPRGRRFRLGITTRRRIRKRQDVENTVQGLAGLIFAHMGLRVNPKITVVHSEFTTTKGARRMGQFIDCGDTPEIELMLKKDHNAWNTASILCHECTHYYMHEKNLHATGTFDEELICDILTIYLGFGAVLKRGYAATTDWQIGYIRESEISYLRRLCVTRRGAARRASREKARRVKQQEAEREKRQKAMAAAMEQQRRLEHARQLYSRVDALARAAYQSGRLPQGKSAVQTMQEIFAELELGELRSALAGEPEKKELDGMIAKLEAWSRLLA